MRIRVALGVLAGFALVSAAGIAGPPNVKGKIAGQDKLVPDVYAEAAKPESRRWTWREPSPSVAAQFRTLSANPSRDLCIAATAAQGGGATDPIRMTVTGGRVFPTTIVVAPNTQLAFKNFDPFKHRVFIVNNANFKPEDMGPNQVRTWAAPSGQNKFEVRDELFPSLRTFIIVDPQVVAVAYPGRDGAFGFNLPAGEYVLKAFFNGRPVGKQVTINAKEKSTLEMKDPFNVAPEGGEGDKK